MTFLVYWCIEEIKRLKSALLNIPNPLAAISGGAADGGPVYIRRLIGVVAPEGVVAGWPGEVYTNTATGLTYQKITGNNTTTGWQ